MHEDNHTCGFGAEVIATIADEATDMIIPHQANQRILDAVAKRTAASVFSNIRQRGNSSSSTIPLALAELLETSLAQCLGLAAFGGGFTFGAAIIPQSHQQLSEPVDVSPRTNFVRDVSGA